MTDETMTYTEAMTSKESKQWKQAMDEEMRTLQRNRTWELIEKPKGQKVVTCKWIFKR